VQERVGCLMVARGVWRARERDGGKVHVCVVPAGVLGTRIVTHVERCNLSITSTAVAMKPGGGRKRGGPKKHGGKKTRVRANEADGTANKHAEHVSGW
jgi:hypothetical protein